MKGIKGTRYTITENATYYEDKEAPISNHPYFKVGDVVVATEDGIIPWVVKESDYVEENSPYDYVKSIREVLSYEDDNDNKKDLEEIK